MKSKRIDPNVASLLQQVEIELGAKGSKSNSINRAELEKGLSGKQRRALQQAIKERDITTQEAALALRGELFGSKENARLSAAKDSTVASVVGQTLLLQDEDRTELLLAIHDGKVNRVEEILIKIGPEGIAQLNNDNVAKSNVENSIRSFNEVGDSSSLRLGLLCAKACFDSGFNYEQHLNVITTKTIIVSGQQVYPSETAKLVASAVRAGLSFGEKMVTYTAIRARDNGRSLENNLAYADLALAMLEKNILPHTDQAKLFYNVVLRSLGFPHTEFKDGEESFANVSLRGLHALKIADALLTNEFPLNEPVAEGNRSEQPSSERRMECLCQDLRMMVIKTLQLARYIAASEHGRERVRAHILENDSLFRINAEELDSLNPNVISGRDFHAEADELQLGIFRLMSKAIKKYPFTGVSVNSAIGLINRTELPLNKDNCNLIHAVIKKALEQDRLRSEMSRETLDVYARELLRRGTEDASCAALELAHTTSRYGLSLNRITLERIQEAVNDLDFSAQEHLRIKRQGLGDLIVAAPQPTGDIEQAIISEVESSSGLRGGLGNPNALTFGDLAGRVKT